MVRPRSISLVSTSSSLVDAPAQTIIAAGTMEYLQAALVRFAEWSRMSGSERVKLRQIQSARRFAAFCCQV